MDVPKNDKQFTISPLKVAQESKDLFKIIRNHHRYYRRHHSCDFVCGPIRNKQHIQTFTSTSIFFMFIGLRRFFLHLQALFVY